jgi:pimeloyl-ACP methyl ester carboxylesterase
VQLALEEVGEGPAVVLLHAGIADRTMWRRLMPELAAAGYRVVAIDLPGFGRSAVAAELDAPWRDVLETCDEIGVDRFAVVGNSFGGAVALRIAATAPERLTALVLVSAPPLELDPSPRLRAVWDDEEEALSEGDVDAATAAVVDGWTLPDAPAELREQIAAMQARAFELQLDAPEPPEAPDPIEAEEGLLGRLGVPALVVAGELDMPDFLEGATPLAQALGVAPPTVIAGAGHLAPLEQPDAFAELLTTFLAEHAPAGNG